MKKTTKFLLVLAAAVAMTIGAVSTVMAADVVVDPATWEENDDGQYTASDTSGNEIKNGWAVDPAGRWYYFQDKLALQDEFLKWRGNWYYFGDDCIMCEGWVEFRYKEDVVNDTDVINEAAKPSGEIGALLKDANDDSAYAKSVWCFFEKGGIAAMDKWKEVDGLWYYFDDIIMVCNDFDYEIADGNKTYTYGFSGDGNMHVGWVPVKSTKKATSGPTGKESSTSTVGFVYYKPDGKIADLGWNKIDNKWYYFAANVSGSKFTKSALACKVDEETPVMLSNMNIVVGSEKFWLTKNGDIATGTMTFTTDKSDKYYPDLESFFNDKTVNFKEEITVDFASNGAQSFVKDSDIPKKNVYYLQPNNNKVYVVAGDDYNKDSQEIVTELMVEKNDEISVSTGSAINVAIAGRKITDAFVVYDGEVYYYDEDGNKVKNSLVDIYGLTIGFNSDGEMIQAEYDAEDPKRDEPIKVAGTKYYFDDSYGNITFDIGGGKSIVGYGCSTKKPE